MSNHIIRWETIELNLTANLTEFNSVCKQYDMSIVQSGEKFFVRNFISETGQIEGHITNETISFSSFCFGGAGYDDYIVCGLFAATSGSMKALLVFESGDVCVLTVVNGSMSHFFAGKAAFKAMAKAIEETMI